ncbi:uncharacterized protein LOC128955395 [Oppia nitens]|uniref:uncharacterized protein LOC128955395 n=1 Tax=Oppia nitens TaxID=1686743 RepID=UPI0023DA50C6|nr:uncharacterized protein LOC128955395 [Oppia nitens]
MCFLLLLLLSSVIIPVHSYLYYPIDTNQPDNNVVDNNSPADGDDLAAEESSVQSGLYDRVLHRFYEPYLRTTAVRQGSPADSSDDLAGDQSSTVLVGGRREKRQEARKPMIVKRQANARRPILVLKREALFLRRPMLFKRQANVRKPILLLRGDGNGDDYESNEVATGGHNDRDNRDQGLKAFNSGLTNSQQQQHHPYLISRLQKMSVIS